MYVDSNLFSLLISLKKKIMGNKQAKKEKKKSISIGTVYIYHHHDNLLKR